MKIRFQILFASLAVILFASSCKKDLLHWQEAYRLDCHTVNRLNRILVIDDSTVMIVGGVRFDESTIAISRDGGTTWATKSFPEAGKGLYGCLQSPDGTLYAIGYDSKLLISKDKGYSWTFRQVGIWQAMKGIACSGNDNLIIIGGVSYNQGERVYTDAAGIFYKRDSTDYEMTDVLMTSPRTGFIAGTGIMLRTTDSMHNWEVQEVRDDNFQALFAVNEQEVYSCGISGSIWKTSDAGNNWQRLRNGNDLSLPRYRLTDLEFRDSNHGYAVGEGGLVIYTDDGGKHWMEYDRFTPAHLYSIALLKNGEMLVSGEGGELWRLKTP